MVKLCLIVNSLPLPVLIDNAYNRMSCDCLDSCPRVHF